MTTEVVEALDISSQAAAIPPMSIDIAAQIEDARLTLPKKCTIEQWMAIGSDLLKIRDRTQFLLGDLVIEGARRFGDLHSAIFDSRNLHTLRKYRNVCERVPPSRRVKELTFRHHDCISSLDPDDQKELLSLAVRKKWTSDELRDAARDRREQREREQQGEDDDVPVRQADGSEVLPPSKFGAPQLRKAEEVDRRPGDGRDDEPGQLVETEPAAAPSSEPVGPILRVDDAGAKTDDSATYLRSVSKTTTSPMMRNTLTDILDERVVLINLVKLVKRAVQVDQITPELRAAVG